MYGATYSSHTRIRLRILRKMRQPMRARRHRRCIRAPTPPQSVCCCRASHRSAWQSGRARLGRTCRPRCAPTPTAHRGGWRCRHGQATQSRRARPRWLSVRSAACTALVSGEARAAARIGERIGRRHRAAFLVYRLSDFTPQSRPTAKRSPRRALKVAYRFLPRLPKARICAIINHTSAYVCCRLFCLAA
jgi:hypothetical protein